MSHFRPGATSHFQKLSMLFCAKTQPNVTGVWCLKQTNLYLVRRMNTAQIYIGDLACQPRMPKGLFRRGLVHRVVILKDTSRTWLGLGEVMNPAKTLITDEVG